MPNNVYIGSRYVPLFDGDWDSTKNYEGLTIVNYQGSSYTSKGPVPAGTLPTNTTYWALTGNYNGQISNLQQQITDMKDGTISGSLQNQITDMKDGTISGSLQNQISDNTNDIDALENKTLTGRYFVLIGDSLGMGNYFDHGALVHGKGWIGHFMDVVGSDHCVYASINGGGFAEPTPYEWLYQLQNTTFPDGITDDMITDVVILGGTNDVANNAATVASKIEEFCGYVKNRFLNLRNLRCGALCEPKFSNKVEELYKSINKYGGYYIDSLENLMCHADFYDSTGHVHPNQAGYNYYAPFIIEAALYGQTHYKFIEKISGITDLAIASGYTWDTGQGTPMLTYLITERSVKMILGGTNSSRGNSAYVTVPANKSTEFFTWTGLEPLCVDTTDSVYIRPAGGSKTTASKDGIICNSNFNTWLGEAAFVAQNYSVNNDGHNTVFVQFCTPDKTNAKRLVINNAQMIISDDTYTINSN